ncbi:MAG: hypothetical protein K2N74_00665 [Clostridiales bacterium]|nr:hypothetical protein [Clostridiales bacterium]
MSESTPASKFCSCTNSDCPLHPTKHDKGCTPCIAANLKTKDLPRCFFYRLGITGEITDTSFRAFAEIVLSQSDTDGE